MIADYEAARIEADEEGTEGLEPRDTEQMERDRDQPGLLATLRSRLAR